MDRQRIDERVRDAAEAALARQHYVSAIDVLLGIGWLTASHVDRWRQGRVACLEGEVQAGLGKVTTAMRAFRSWANEQGLVASETDYTARTPDRRRLRFSVSGDPEIERAYRTHWVSPELSRRKRERLAEQASKPQDLVVVWARKEWTCEKCGRAHSSGELLTMVGDGPHCLNCAGLGRLEYLPAGNAAITRRAKRLSGESAVVVRWSRTRKRYERQGILAEPDAIRQASETA